MCYHPVPVDGGGGGIHACLSMNYPKLKTHHSLSKSDEKTQRTKHFNIRDKQQQTRRNGAAPDTLKYICLSSKI